MAAVTAAVLAAGPVRAATDLSGLMPAGEKLTGEVYQISADEKVEALAAKMSEAISEDPDWFNEYIGQQNKQPGDPLPYHPNFGLTRTEYELMIAGMTQIGLRQVGEVTLEFPRKDGMVHVIAGGMKLPVNGVVIDPQKDLVQTEFAILAEKSPVDQTDASSPTGRWTGYQWEMAEGTNLYNFYSEIFAVGRQTDSGRGVIYYDRKSPAYGTVHYVILFDLPGK